MTINTLVIVLKDNKILLGRKKRGLGLGNWNGFGGKLQEGESVEQAAVRELEEEIGLRAKIEHLEPRGVIYFRSNHNPKLNIDAHLFTLRQWEGEPTESDETAMPEWFRYGDPPPPHLPHQGGGTSGGNWSALPPIPYGDMWPDDKHWLPIVLRGANIEAEFHFDATGDDFEKYGMREIQKNIDIPKNIP